jgi:hypothetical protein
MNLDIKNIQKGDISCPKIHNIEERREYESLNAQQNFP